MSVNSVSLSGHLGGDSVLKKTRGGTSVLELSLAVDHRVRGDDGEWKDGEPDWVSCSVFGKRAEALQRYLRRGTKVSVHGSIRTDQWEKDGQRRSKTYVVLDEVDLMSRPGDQNGQQTPAVAPPAPAAQAPQTAPDDTVPADAYDADIPF